MKFATRNASAVLAASALLATAPVSASLPELSSERSMETVEVVEKMIAAPAGGMTALTQIRSELDESLIQETSGALLQAVQTGFETARVAREEAVRTDSDEDREEVAAETLIPSAFDLSSLDITDDSAPRALSF